MMLSSGCDENAKPSLQDAFQRFRKAKQEKIRMTLQAERKAAERRCDPQQMAELRKKFVEKALQYLGVPYAKKFHEPGTPDYDSPLFLDCCALVRRVLRDLENDFGFAVGPWNQAYQFDSLPMAIECEEDMKPGDLVFISGTYFNSKSKQHPHDMVHVEIWLGDGVKTIGARWHRGHVQIHDSYRFVSKSYYNMVYHFRSIDTWLKGICKSHCPVHPWRAVKYLPGKKSIFALDLQDESADGDEPIDGDTPPQSSKASACALGESNASSETSPLGAVGSKESQTKPSKGNESKKDNDDGKAKEKPKPPQKSHSGKTFFIGGGNGVALVETPLAGRGWERIYDQHSRSFRLKWVEVKSQIDYLNFREGEQLVNHIPNINLLTTKIGLLDNLRDYCKRKSLVLADFFPETYKLDVKSERETFFSHFQEGSDVWICKPTGMNQGKGIFLVRDLVKFQSELEEHDKAIKAGRRSKLSSRIVQRYIRNPLLLEGRKFDIRTYLLIAHTMPYFVFYHHGYVRLSCQPYSLDAESMAAHLTNQYVQKRDPLYSERKEDTVWTFEQMQAYLDAHRDVAPDWMSNSFTKQMQQIMMKCFHSVRHRLKCRLGFFELLGFDFMIDDDMKVYLIEINVNPALHTNCEGLKLVIPPMIKETLDLSIELFEKTRQRRQLLPLDSAKNFQLLYHEVSSTRKPLSPIKAKPKKPKK
ncbi:protein polyglycylase TTLL10-like [Oscarella lobularis]|uniref:protein polyglycylase TTLL10-like n=1 Tax=Oscarella lobularis TaxID=121494 RepID=UPI003313EAE5